MYSIEGKMEKFAVDAFAENKSFALHPLYKF